MENLTGSMLGPHALRAFGDLGLECGALRTGRGLVCVCQDGHWCHPGSLRCPVVGVPLWSVLSGLQEKLKGVTSDRVFLLVSLEFFIAGSKLMIQGIWRFVSIPFFCFKEMKMSSYLLLERTKINTSQYLFKRHICAQHLTVLFSVWKWTISLQWLDLYIPELTMP